MGHSITPKHIVQAQDNFGKWQTSIWRGRVSVARLEDWRTAHNQGFDQGGVNFHVSQACGYIVHYGNCRIVEQRTGAVVCEYQAPLFEIA